MRRIIGIAITTIILTPVTLGALWAVDANVTQKLVLSDDRRELVESFNTMLAYEGLPDAPTLLGMQRMGEVDLDTAEAEAVSVVLVVFDIAEGSNSVLYDFADGLSYDELRCLTRGMFQYALLFPGRRPRLDTFEYCLDWQTNLNRYLSR